MHLDGQDFGLPCGLLRVRAGRGCVIPSSRRGRAAESSTCTPRRALVGYFEELAAAIAEGVDETGLDALAERYQMEIVGPVPEGYL